MVRQMALLKTALRKTVLKTLPSLRKPTILLLNSLPHRHSFSVSCKCNVCVAEMGVHLGSSTVIK